MGAFDSVYELCSSSGVAQVHCSSLEGGWTAPVLVLEQEECAIALKEAAPSQVAESWAAFGSWEESEGWREQLGEVAAS